MSIHRLVAIHWYVHIPTYLNNQLNQGMDRYRWRTLPEIFETLASLAPQVRSLVISR